MRPLQSNFLSKLQVSLSPACSGRQSLAPESFPSSIESSLTFFLKTSRGKTCGLELEWGHCAENPTSKYLAGHLHATTGQETSFLTTWVNKVKLLWYRMAGVVKQADTSELTPRDRCDRIYGGSFTTATAVLRQHHVGLLLHLNPSEDTPDPVQLTTSQCGVEAVQRRIRLGTENRGKVWKATLLCLFRDVLLLRPLTRKRMLCWILLLHEVATTENQHETMLMGAKFLDVAAAEALPRLFAEGVVTTATMKGSPSRSSASLPRYLLPSQRSFAPLLSYPKSRNNHDCVVRKAERPRLWRPPW
jgi:hypothetical protein